MVILYEIEKDGKIEQLVSDPFVDEVNDMEPFIIENLSLLSENEEYHLLNKEPTSGKTRKRADILALDESGRLIIIELKKDYADERFESQIRGYWRDYKESPDTIGKFWERAKDRLGKIKYDSALEPKVVVVAPEISDEWVQSSSHELNLDISFIEVKRFKKGSQTYISINDKVPLTIKKPRESSSREDYGREHYVNTKKWNPEDVEIIMKMDDEINAFKEREGFDIHREFKQNYIPYKHGPRNIVFDFSWQAQKIYLRLSIRLKNPNTKIGSKLLVGSEPDWYLNQRGQFELEFDRKTVPDFSLLEEPIKLAYATT